MMTLHYVALHTGKERAILFESGVSLNQYENTEIFYPRRKNARYSVNPVLVWINMRTQKSFTHGERTRDTLWVRC